MIAAFIFWLSALALFHSYVFYPLLLKLFSIGKKHNDVTFTANDELPLLYVFMSVYNEEKVLDEKLRSVMTSVYPADKLKAHVGSDGSTDRSDEIVRKLSEKFPNLHLRVFEGRAGKSEILNRLVEAAQKEITDPGKTFFVFTDANVIFTPDTLFELAKHFRNQEIAIVGANILNKGLKKEGISLQEKSYIERENHIKYLEGLNWGVMMGAFGACYAIRSDYFDFIPENFLMEDFYITMRALEKKGKAIIEPRAVCYEDVSDEVAQEFKRKVRISAGNYQNLGVFWKLLFPLFSPLSFSFFSHKVLRWMGPYFIAAAYLSCLWLALTIPFYGWLLLIQTVLLLSPAFDFVLKKIGIHSVLLRFVSYFYLMNLALVFGMVKYFGGIRTNVWEPTKRNTA